MLGVAVSERRHRYLVGASDPRRATGDRARPYPSEAVLVRLWAGQRFPAAALVTRSGAPLRVLHPGRPGRGAGPDFRDAIVASPAGLLRGDVELHVRASDFAAHGHERDARYGRLALHVVFEDDGQGDTPLANGRRAPVVALGDWLRRRTEELAGWLSGPGLWREPCHDAIARLGEAAVLQVLEEQGERRFREREAALAGAIGRFGAGEALYRALLAGLGYGRSEGGTPAALADILPWRELSRRAADLPDGERALSFEALLLGAAGLLPARPGGRSSDPYEQALEERWRQAGLASLVPPPPPTARPANHPARRLAGLARLLARHGARFAVPASLLGPLEVTDAGLVAGWTVPARGYWRRSLAPGRSAKKPPGALIGRSRALELLVNALLPWAAAFGEARVEPELAARARALYARLPRPAPYGALAFLEANLRPGERPLRLDARRQQGLLALYKAECTQGGCGRCPLS